MRAVFMNEQAAGWTWMWVGARPAPAAGAGCLHWSVSTRPAWPAKCLIRPRWQILPQLLC